MKIACPCVVIKQNAYSLLLDYVKSTHAPTATITFKETTHRVKPAPLVANYASRGPSRYIPKILKPDVMAPGTHVLTAWPSQNLIPIGCSHLFSDFRIHFGTSFAAPHAAGVAALLKGAHPKWSRAAIRSAIMTTADILDNTFKPIKQSGPENLEVALPPAMGAGHINPNRALDPGLIYDAIPRDYVRLLCSMRAKKYLLSLD